MTISERRVRVAKDLIDTYNYSKNQAKLAVEGCHAEACKMTELEYDSEFLEATDGKGQTMMGKAKNQFHANWIDATVDNVHYMWRGNRTPIQKQ